MTMNSESKVVIDMTMSLDGFVAGPGDGKEYPLGKHDGMRIFDWYFSGQEPYRHELFRPEPGAQSRSGEVDVRGIRRLYLRTTDLRHHQRLGRRAPVNGVPVFVLTHTPPPPTRCPRGRRTSRSSRTASPAPSGRHARSPMAKTSSLAARPPGSRRYKAGLCDEILIHLAPYLLGDGVRLLDHLGGPIRLEKLSVSDGPLATHSDTES